MTVNGYRVSFGEDDNVLKQIVVINLYHNSVNTEFKCMNSVACKLYSMKLL